MAEYDVHLFPVYRIVVRLEADSPAEAVKEADRRMQQAEMPSGIRCYGVKERIMHFADEWRDEAIADLLDPIDTDNVLGSNVFEVTAGHWKEAVPDMRPEWRE